MQQSGIDAAIRELQQDVERVQEAIALLRKIRTIQGQRTARVTKPKSGRRRLSADARRRISEAAKRRWAAQAAKRPRA